MEKLSNNEAEEIFEVGDQVIWKKEMSYVEDLVEKYGEGPFKILSIGRTIPKRFVIEMRDGRKMPFAVEWFIKQK